MLARIAALSAMLAAGAIAQDSAPAVLSVTGDIPFPIQLKADDLAKLPRETVTMHEEKGANAQYEGVPLREILAKAGALLGKDLRGKALSTYVLAKARDGYEVVFSIGELDQTFGNESILVADKREGKPLAAGSLGPLRLVCPNDKAGARSMRMLETIEVVRLYK